jgi:hypothetical protein
MDGNGHWNTELESVIPQELSASRLERFEMTGSNLRIDWPKYEALVDYSNPEVEVDGEMVPVYEEFREPYMSNFNFTDSCQLRTAMCCFTEARHPSNPIVHNSDACHHNIHDSRRSSHLNKGYAVYSVGQAKTGAYCVGFSWDEDPESISNLYKGNALYDISYGTFHREGWRKNLPGAPMCGCIENMPVVTKADCTEVTPSGVQHNVSLQKDEDGLPYLHLEQIAGSIKYDSCGGTELHSLRRHYEDLQSNGGATADELAAIEDRFPGDCETKTNEFLNKRFYVPGTSTQWDKPDPSEWEAMYGRGLSYVPRMLEFDGKNPYNMVKEDEFFRSKLSESCRGDIVYRHCDSCHESHQHIYYKRLTPIPDVDPDGEPFNYLDLFLNNWHETNNTMGVDFSLYSTFDDAINGVNEWTYCNYGASGVGFPRDCGPVDYTPCQWNTHYRKSICGNVEYTAISHAFYVYIGTSNCPQPQLT